MELTEADVLNIKQSVEKIQIHLNERWSNRELHQLSVNPLKYFKRFGLSKKVEQLISSNGDVYYEFQTSIRDFIRKVKRKVISTIDDCFQCVMGLLTLLAIFSLGSGITEHILTDYQEVLLQYLVFYFGSNYFIKSWLKAFVDFMKKAGIPHLSINNLAKYLCFQAGLCPDKGIL
jgi:hypothetical protein